MSDPVLNYLARLRSWEPSQRMLENIAALERERLQELADQASSRKLRIRWHTHTEKVAGCPRCEL